MITLKSPREVETMARAGRIVAGVLTLMRDLVRPGVTTEELDAAAESFIRGHPGAAPSFKGLYGFPKTLAPPSTRKSSTAFPPPSAHWSRAAS